MLTALAGEGLNKGVVKFLSDKEINTTDKQYFFLAGIALHLIIFLGACLLVIINHENLRRFTGNFFFITWLGWVMIPLLANLLNLFCVALVQSQHRFKLFSFLNTLNIVLSAFFIYLVANKQDITLALLAYNLGQGISLLITLPLAWSILRIFFPHFKKLSIHLLENKIKKLSDFLAIGLSIVVFSRFGFYLMREYNMATFGLAKTGLWEAAMRISEGYTFTFNTTFLVIFYPKVASLIPQPKLLRRYIWQTLQFLLPLILAGLLLAFFLKEQLLILLFDASFLPATSLLAWVMIGDFFKFINYLLSNILIAKGKTRLFIFLQGVFIGLSFLMVYLLSRSFSLQALPITWVSTYILSVVVLGIILRKDLFG
jgi:PST family polysaccharide transporter